MSLRKQKARNRPSHAAPLATPTAIHVSAFHPVRPLYAVATTAIGQNVVQIYDTDKATTGSSQAPRTEIRLPRSEEVSCLVWKAGASDEAKKQKRRDSAAANNTGELVCGFKSGRIVVIEQASGETVRTLDGHSAAVTGWAADEQGHESWSCANDGKLRAWDTRTGAPSTYFPPFSLLPPPPSRIEAEPDSGQ
jgi:WD40 repeat protein